MTLSQLNFEFSRGVVVVVVVLGGTRLTGTEDHLLWSCLKFAPLKYIDLVAITLYCSPLMTHSLTMLT